jgi:hypothetical protein
MSKSGVDLRIGQKVFFYHKGRKYLLLEVTNDLRDQTLSVGKLIRGQRSDVRSEGSG